MNREQNRILLECEFKFYQAQLPSTFHLVLKSIGWKPRSKCDDLSDEQLKRLNIRLRSYLRSTP